MEPPPRGDMTYGQYALVVQRAGFPALAREMTQLALAEHRRVRDDARVLAAITSADSLQWKRVMQAQGADSAASALAASAAVEAAAKSGADAASAGAAAGAAGAASAASAAGAAAASPPGAANAWSAGVAAALAAVGAAVDSAAEAKVASATTEDEAGFEAGVRAEEEVVGCADSGTPTMSRKDFEAECDELKASERSLLQRRLDTEFSEYERKMLQVTLVKAGRGKGARDKMEGGGGGGAEAGNPNEDRGNGGGGEGAGRWG